MTDQPKNRSGAERLRAAAEEARKRELPSGQRDPLHAAIGRWLDAAATELEWVQKHNDRQAERAARLGGTDGHTYVMAHALVAPAIDVADAYLGEA